ncbi:MAG: MFS transporter [Candidatus Methanoplasma sp.]|jgi:EmrB/QacA subfamily drug resistance transporter|nr:MFS transporter [Candidatus Methanoplasma sp.]
MKSDGKGATGILLVIAVVCLMDGLDGSVVNVALPTLADGFGTDAGTIAWITVVYFLMLAGLLMLFARVADNGAIRKVAVAGVAVFTLGSLLCGVSPSFEALLAARGVQGVGAAMMGASAPMICVRHLPRGMLGLGMGVLTLGCSVGFAVGPAIGGLIIDALSWHWIFLINVPVGLLMIPMMLALIPKDERYEKKPLDAKGAALLFAAVAAGAFALERMPHGAERTWALLAAAACVICLAAFVATELRSRAPLLNVRVFKHMRFDSLFLAFMLLNVAYMGLLYLFPFYLEVCMGFRSAESGLYLFIPPAITLAICVPISRWSDRAGRRAFAVAACAALLAGAVAMFLFSRSDSTLLLLFTLSCMGLTWGFAGGPMASRIVENTSEESREIGSSLMNESIYLGGTIGLSLFAMIFTIGADSGAVDFRDLTQEVFLDGFVLSAAVCAVVAVVALMLSAAVKDVKA